MSDTNKEPTEVDLLNQRLRIAMKQANAAADIARSWRNENIALEKKLQTAERDLANVRRSHAKYRVAQEASLWFRIGRRLGFYV